jgi:RNA polymerase sigma-70 factor (ECF subfamily)
VHWLRAAALRVAQDFARSRRPEVASDDDALVNTPAVGNDADVALLKSRFAPQFKAAFQEALAGLSARDQNLLRLHYLDGVSPDEIGRLYSTHRTTVWRWLTQCRAELLEKTRALLATRVPTDDSEFASLMNAVHSQLDVSLSRMLRKP